MKRLFFVLLIMMIAFSAFANGAKEAEAPKVEMKNLDSLMDSSWDAIYEQAKAEGEVVFFIWHDEACYTEIAKAFEKAYPGVKFNLVVSDSSAALDKMVAEATEPKGSFDVAVINAPQTLLNADALFGPIVQKLENYEKLDQNLCMIQEGYVHNGYLAPLYRNQGGLLYNPAKVPNPPETWAELEAWIDANPKKFGVCHPLQGGSGGVFILSAIDNLCGGLDKYTGDIDADPEKMANWGIMWNWFLERMDKITITSSNNDSLSRLNQGELDLVVAWDDGTYTAKSNGELFKDVTFYIPEFGMPGGGDTIGILKNSQHPAASLLLANFLTGDVAQTLINDFQHAYPGRTDIEVKYTVIPPEDLVNRTNWTPYAYKRAYCLGFVSEVLQKAY
ncbi:MAG: extracellular solute-binding protein [Spirochaetales bacterium]|nr:extracellular solute-binding protein [Spirochaetales bacterium]